MGGSRHSFAGTPSSSGSCAVLARPLARRGQRRAAGTCPALAFQAPGNEGLEVCSKHPPTCGPKEGMAASGCVAASSSARSLDSPACRASLSSFLRPPSETEAGRARVPGVQQLHGGPCTCVCWGHPRPHLTNVHAGEQGAHAPRRACTLCRRAWPWTAACPSFWGQEERRGNTAPCPYSQPPSTPCSDMHTRLITHTHTHTHSHTHLRKDTEVRTHQHARLRLRANTHIYRGAPVLHEQHDLLRGSITHEVHQLRGGPVGAVLKQQHRRRRVCHLCCKRAPLAGHSFRPSLEPVQIDLRRRGRAWWCT